jgi:hypothetical protein
VVAQFWRSLSVEGEEARFERNIAGWMLAIRNLLTALDSTVFFLIVLRAGIVG